MNSLGLLLTCMLLLCANQRMNCARPAPHLGDGVIGGKDKHEKVHVQLEDDGITLSASTSSPTISKRTAAVGSFVPALASKSDFAQLRIVSSGTFPDAVQMRAAGFAEGYLTAEMINDHWSNMQWWLRENTASASKLDAWLWEQGQWTRQQVQQHKDSGSTDAFWVAMQYLMEQFDGMVQGYNSRVQEAGAQHKQGQRQMQGIDARGFLILNAFGDIDDLLEIIDMDREGLLGDSPQALNPDWDHMSPGRVRARIAQRSHCSALVKVTPDLSDILMAHTTWWSYSAMLRVFKHYKFNLVHPVIRSQAQSFSSYPGTLSSIDDWYVLDTKMVVTETSNDVYNKSLYLLSTNQAALSWQRARVANMVSEDGQTWAKYISSYNSGTYNNQYMVVDLKRFKPYGELQPGLLTIVETMPGSFVYADTTQELERGYWPSYNVPYFPAVYNATGYNLLSKKLLARGPEFRDVVAGLNYQLASRAQLFRRDAGSVMDLDSLKHLVRSNGWPRDVLSHSPWDAISARGDLSPDPDGREAYGAYDAKATNYQLAINMGSEVVNGPTWGSGLPPFSWADWPEVAHQGMREVYDTEWEVQQP